MASVAEVGRLFLRDISLRAADRDVPCAYCRRGGRMLDPSLAFGQLRSWRALDGRFINSGPDPRSVDRIRALKSLLLPSGQAYDPSGGGIITDHYGPSDFRCGAQVMDGNEPFGGHGGEGAVQPLMLATDGGRWRAGCGPRRVSLERIGQWQVEDDCHGRPAMAPSHVVQLLACPRLDVGGVDDGEATASQAHGTDSVQQVEGVIRGSLRRWIVGDQRAEPIRREDLGRLEVASREGGLAGCGNADQEDKRIGRQGDGSRPTAGFSGGRWCCQRRSPRTSPIRGSAPSALRWHAEERDHTR